eukprot:CAMPEP_0204351280 /NCGR_PEP_ID=MMETSP0469-20131031/30997_1 /ASSEMBLY_ACC=CAM_ASM_000384 /TAXON_ID=2969 /ORGANISM="Oxyrrhis marina" /LENGTH=354 /DNA_ID=CAMNT_0051337793 /DNA_START=89 /DNA_END=1153 /DNA_ORIENTATION=-
MMLRLTLISAAAAVQVKIQEASIMRAQSSWWGKTKTPDATRGGCQCQERWKVSASTCPGGKVYEGCGMVPPCDGDTGGMTDGSWCFIDPGCTGKPVDKDWDYCVPAGATGAEVPKHFSWKAYPPHGESCPTSCDSPPSVIHGDVVCLEDQTKKVDEKMCTGSRPHAVEIHCPATERCLKHEWVADEPDQCPTHCGALDRILEGTVHCRGDSGNIVSATVCAHKRRPPLKTRSCKATAACDVTCQDLQSPLEQYGSNMGKYTCEMLTHYCKDISEWGRRVRIGCRQTCDMCSAADSSAAGCKDAGAPLEGVPDTSLPLGHDHHSTCSALKLHCTDTRVVRENCPATCGICGSGSY